MLDRVKQLIELIPPTIDVLFGAEIGVYKAEMSVELLKYYSNLCLLLVDGWVPYNGGDWTSNQNQQTFDLIKQEAIMKTASWRNHCFIIDQPSPAASLIIPNESLDFVFIDGNHQYEAVLEDLEAWYPKVKTGKLLIGHDYVRSDGHTGVQKAVMEFSDHLNLLHDTGKDTTWWIWKPCLNH